MSVNYEECKKAGLNPKEVEKIDRGLSRYGRQADKLGLTIFGGSGSGSLRIYDAKGSEDRALVVAEVDGLYDGGDGACWEDSDGLLRGE